MSDMRLENATVVKHEPVRGGYRLLVLKCRAIADATKPGQFVHMRIPSQEVLVLRRPFSIFKVHEDTISVLYKKVGRGTAAMDALKAGDNISLLGPLGKGFPVGGPELFPILVAGGYGIAALYLLAKQFPARGIIFVGGKTADDILCTEDFTALGWSVRVATEDGSIGERGLVTELLTRWMDKESAGASIELYACGPDGMLRAVSNLARGCGLRAWLSMDKHMGCGVGACLACVCRIRYDGGQVRMGRVCKDGPVFECRQIAWDNEITTKT